MTFSSGQLTVGDLVKNKYRVLERVAAGGMGEVYRVLEVSSNQIWAMKRMFNRFGNQPIPKEELESFWRESEILKLSQHHSLPRFHDHFEEYGSPFLVMEFIEGQTLEKVLKMAGKPLDYQAVYNWALELSQVLYHLHSQLPKKIIYRDLKPSNIMLTETGNIKLIDFGIARFSHPLKTKDTIALGTRGYAPPEQVLHGLTDERSDIFSLGATLHHLLTNNDPDSQSIGSIALNFDFLPVRQYNSAVPSEFEQAITYMTKVEISHRPVTMMEVFSLLQRVPLNPQIPITNYVRTQYPRSNATIITNPNSKQPNSTIPLPETPGLVITPSELDFGTQVRPGMSQEQMVQFRGTGRYGEPLTGSVNMLEAVNWLEYDKSRFGLGQNCIKVTANPAKAPLGHSNWQTLNFYRLYRDFSNHISPLAAGFLILLGLAILAVVSSVFGHLSFILAILIGLVVLQIELLWHQWLIHLIVPAYRVSEATIVFRSNGGTANIKAFIKVYPSNLQILLGWIMATLIAILPAGIALRIIFK